MRYLNQLEPNELVDSFLDCPPQDFHVQKTTNNIPFFATNFDLLTTADDGLRKFLKRTPFYKYIKVLTTP